MTEKSEKQLGVEFPTVFGENLFFECGDGWIKLITEIASFISNKTKHCRAVQVKEKFGGLRFYVEFSYDEGGVCLVDEQTITDIYQFITDTEEKSVRICETCGVELTSLNKCPQSKLGHWIQNICLDCEKNLV